MAERVIQSCCCCCAPTFTVTAPHTGDDFGTDLPLLLKLHEIWLHAFLENRQKLLPPDVRFYG